MLSLFISGVSDAELQQDLMPEQGITLNKAVTIAVARVTAKRSQEVFDTNQQQNAGISTYKKGLKKVDVQMGIIEKVPADTPAIWCHKMVVTSKPGSHKPRRTVDMSSLKTKGIPAETYKTVTDAWQGFHMIPLDPDSMKYTTFLTEEGMYSYKRMPMGEPRVHGRIQV